MMKTKRKPFVQHLAHDVEDSDKAWEFLDESLPSIGYIVMSFNGLEKQLDSMLCQTFSDRSDATGLIVLQNIQYSAKVNLFSRFCDDFHAMAGTVPKSYEKLMSLLRDAAKKRNTVVHADWESIGEDGYVYSTFRISDEGMEQEYVQLTSGTLELIINMILDARKQLDEYWADREHLLAYHSLPPR